MVDKWEQHVEEVENPPSDNLQSRAEELVPETPKRKWTSYIWDSLDKSPEERRLVLKLDCALLTFGCLGKVNLVVLQPSNAVERIFYQIS